MMSRTRFSRRSFLQAAGLGSALLPLLEADLVRAGCLPSGRKRLVIMNWGNGLEQRVSGTETNFVLPAIMSSLEPHRSSLLIPNALFNKGFDDMYPKNGFDNEAHDSPIAWLVAESMRTNAPTASLDYFIGNKIKDTAHTPWSVINLGVMRQRPYHTWQAASVAATPDDDPYHAFDTIFGGQKMATATPNMDQARLVRKSVLDFVQKDIGRFSQTLGKEDRLRIDGHLSSIRDIESRLTPTTVDVACQVPVLGAKFDVQSSDNYEKTVRAQIDIGVAALAAGLSQVLTLQVTNGIGAHVILSWLGYQKTGTDAGNGGGDLNAHHAVAHAGGTRKDQVDKWFFDQMAYMITKLKAEKEGTTSMFDNTVLLVTNNMDRGNHHKVIDVPWLIAGTGGGYFKTGRYIAANNAPHAQLLIAVANAMGVSTNGFIDPAYGGELPGVRG